MHNGVRVLLIAFVAGMLAGCANFHPTQTDGKVRLRVGNYDKERPAERVAAHYLPYAIFALRAYDVNGVKGKRWHDLGDQIPLAERWIKGWTLEDKKEGELPCGAHRLICIPLGGLGYQVWVKNGCSEVVIAFRGTNFTEIEDWISNLRWVTRILPFFDQYEQVQDNIDTILKATRMGVCAGKTPSRIVAVGHSLGGGLAQQAAYMRRAIRPAIVFDPTFVTGYADRHVPREDTRKGLNIERVYEHGEWIAYLRYIVRQIYPNTAADPQIRTARFNKLHGGSVIAQHSIADMVKYLLKTAGPPPGHPTERLPVPSNAE